MEQPKKYVALIAIPIEAASKEEAHTKAMEYISDKATTGDLIVDIFSFDKEDEPSE